MITVVDLSGWMTEEDKKKEEKIRQERFISYNVVYEDTDGEFRTGWHHITQSNMSYVKEKYKKQGRRVISFVPIFGIRAGYGVYGNE